MDTMTFLNLAWSAPLQIILSLIFLYLTMGLSIFAGFAVMVMMIPLNAALATQTHKLQARQMKEKDSRIKLVNEVLNGIKVCSDNEVHYQALQLIRSLHTHICLVQSRLLCWCVYRVACLQQ